MSVFRPMNSDESNLFTIRFSVKALAAVTSDTVLFDADASTKVSTSLATPTINLLPTNCKLAINYGGSAGSNVYELEYGKEFTQDPSIYVTPHSASSDATDTAEALIPVVRKINRTAGSVNAHILFRLAVMVPLHNVWWF